MTPQELKERFCFNPENLFRSTTRSSLNSLRPTSSRPTTSGTNRTGHQDKPKIPQDDESDDGP